MFNLCLMVELLRVRDVLTGPTILSLKKKSNTTLSVILLEENHHQPDAGYLKHKILARKKLKSCL